MWPTPGGPLATRLERHQVLLYVAAIVGAAAVGWAVPGADALDVAINPVIALLLYATFLAVPFPRIGAALRDVRFLGVVLGLNFLVVPVVVLLLSRLVASDEVLLVGVLLVLLTPCVDYVIVFSRIAGGAAERLLAAAPLLLLLQMLLLPGYLWLLVGPEVADVVALEPFVEAFLLLIVVPLAAAATTQLLARRHRAAERLMELMALAMVPLMMTTLAVVVASQIAGVGAALSTLALVVPVYVAFLVVMAPVGAVAARLARLDVPSARALTFSGATRNSLVVLPLALALPDGYALVPLVVVTQTLVELVGMVVYVRLVPRLVPARRP